MMCQCSATAWEVMPGSGDSSASSASDDEESQRLREASVDPATVLKEATEGKVARGTLPQHGTVSVQSKNRRPLTKPSLRPPEKTVGDENELQTTPEFRAHVAKKLTKVLDKSVQLVATSDSREENKCADSEGPSQDFRLFSTSVPEEPVKTTSKCRRPSTSSSSSEDEERFSACAVSGHDILAAGGMTPGSRLQSGSPGGISQRNEEIKNRVEVPLACVNGAELDTSGSTTIIAHRKKKKAKRKQSVSEDSHDEQNLCATWAVAHDTEVGKRKNVKKHKRKKTNVDHTEDNKDD